MNNSPRSPKKESGLQISLTADDMLTLDFGSHEKANQQVRAFWQYLQEHPISQDLSPVAGMNCIGFMIHEQADNGLDVAELGKRIIELAKASLKTTASPGRTVEIPICYDISMAPDLQHLADHCGISAKEVIQRHSAGRYVAQLIGFLPGFAYLGGLDPKLATPRLSTPRAKVAPGSLGIAGTQCAIYPTASPGGWNLIGRSPTRLFDPTRDDPCAIQLGDEVRFVPISVKEFERQWASR